MSSTRSMVALPGGAFTMGSARFYPEERPPRRVVAGPYRIDEVPVTNAEFARFVADTGYRTMAENPGADGGPAGSMVFVQPSQPVSTVDPSAWWAFRAGAQWRFPEGPGSSLEGREDHPVVHVAWADAAAYAAWAGKALPTEIEWEYAARGGLEGADYAWGNALAPDGQMLANTWQGEFPHLNLRLDGWAGTSPVGAFPANGHGLHDLIGNVWEWTADDWSLPGPADEPRSKARCCSGGSGTVAKVIKGGSYLCSPDYCQRYRPAARHPQGAGEATGHIGFRCVVR